MSIEVMSLVWKNYNRGGSEKLAMLALADWCNEHGRSLHPSVNGVAKKINVSESQARRILHGLIEEGYLEVVANHGGGAPGQTRQYKLNLDLLKTPSADATPSVDATPSTDARDDSHGCALPLAPMTPEPSLSINNHQTPNSRATRFNPNAKAEDGYIEAALSVRAIDLDEIKRVFDEFRDYWIAVPGAKGVKLDWIATWRNWVRRAKTTAALTVKKNQFVND
jgi:hypothetical protein